MAQACITLAHPRACTRGFRPGLGVQGVRCFGVLGSGGLWKPWTARHFYGNRHTDAKGFKMLQASLGLLSFASLHAQSTLKTASSSSGPWKR